MYDPDYCHHRVCGHGDGDCDPGTCPSGLSCGMNNFVEYHPLLASGCRSAPSAEVCVKDGKNSVYKQYQVSSQYKLYIFKECQFFAMIEAKQ